MIGINSNMQAKAHIIHIFKLLACFFVVLFMFDCVKTRGFDDYFFYENFSYRNEVSDQVSYIKATKIEQAFVSDGNILSNIELYFGEAINSELRISINDTNGKNVFETNINPFRYGADGWTRLAVDCDEIEKNKSYFLVLEGDDLSCVAIININSNTDIFKECHIDNDISKYTLATSIQGTYKYLHYGYGLQLLVTIGIVIGISLALSWTIINIEKLYIAFDKKESKYSFLYAIYFSLYTVLLFNPLDTIRNEMSKFSRVVGSGVVAGVDVSRRIGNFSFWFIGFASLFLLFFLLSTYIRSKAYTEESIKALKFLDSLIVVGNSILLLRCITFFSDESVETNTFYYSTLFITLVIILSIAYIVLRLDRHVSHEIYKAINISLWMISFFVPIVLSRGWYDGRAFIGLQYVTSLIAVFLIVILKDKLHLERKQSCTYVVAILLSFVPLFTSFYIEFISLMNQRGVFLSEIRQLYLTAIIFGVIIIAIVICYLNRKKYEVKSWKNIAYPCLVFGFSCLWQQIPVSAEYSADLFETANSSILISDFLNFGKIPIVEHYGGHMMSGVWEGLLYALLNNDSFGAVFSPYAGYTAAVVAVLFLLFIENIWTDDIAFIITLFFPYYSSISYWGFGLIVCLAAMFYVGKKTYIRALIFWLICIWVALYRLDMGFAFIIASIFSLLTYAFIKKNYLAIKQLGITLLAWLAIGIAIWFAICIFRNINPINRLLEFLHINLSNQNWAFATIGDSGYIRFSFVYIIFPFISIIALLCSIFHENIRKNLGTGNWIMLLILGFSYFVNFSRGLVRHSLAELAISICLWSVYIFLSLFAVAITNKKIIFLPVFTSLIIFNSLLLSGYNVTTTSIADGAITHMSDYTESWDTYWEEIKDKKEVIERVKLTDDLEDSISGYQFIMDKLLDDEETYVDLINKTTIYSLIGRENPVYVSQSPLQLSGEFTQEEFIKQIGDIPLVLMPCDSVNYYASEQLDGVANSYRYYKVFEYVYQNYKPLCKYENQFAVWCLTNRYDEFADKFQQLKDSESDITSVIATVDSIWLNSAELVSNADGSLNINYTGVDPIVAELQNTIDITEYIDENISIALEYETDVLGPMQIFYTTEYGEEYTGNKVSTYTAQTNSGTAYFQIPITEYTRIRFDTPEGSEVKIKSFKVGTHNCDFIEYGYDGPYLQEDGVNYFFLPSVHSYALDKLPLVWAEGDLKKSVDNRVVSDLIFSDNLYHYNIDDSYKGVNGNYLKINLTYNGNDLDRKIKSDDETIGATVKIGKYSDGIFETKYQYTFTATEGTHDYIFRISNDYYWYIDETNSVQLECSDKLFDINMQILEGD